MSKHIVCPFVSTLLKLSLLLLAIALPLFISAEVGISYSLQDLGYSQEEGELYYSFDILAQASEAGTGIGTGIIYLAYSSAAFGDWIKTNGNMSVTKGNLSTYPSADYGLFTNDRSANVLAVTFEFQGLGGSGNPLPIAPTQLLRVKLKLQDPSQNVGIEFWPAQQTASWQNRMEDQQYYDDNATPYNPVSAGVGIFANLQLLNQSIALQKGWNLVSTRLSPLDNDLWALFSELIQDGDLIKVQDQSGNSLVKNAEGQWQNGIGTLKTQEGYYVQVAQSCTLEITGLELSLPLTIPLGKGWNIIPYPYTAARDAMEVLQPLISLGLLIKVQDDTGASIVQNTEGGWINGIGNFQAGKAYYLQVSQAFPLVYALMGSKVRPTGLLQLNQTAPLDYNKSIYYVCSKRIR